MSDFRIWMGWFFISYCVVTWMLGIILTLKYKPDMKWYAIVIAILYLPVTSWIYGYERLRVRRR